MNRTRDAFELECLSVLETTDALPDGCDTFELMRDGLVADGDTGPLHLTDLGRHRLAALRAAAAESIENRH